MVPLRVHSTWNPVELVGFLIQKIKTSSLYIKDVSAPECISTVMLCEDRSSMSHFKVSKRGKLQLPLKCFHHDAFKGQSGGALITNDGEKVAIFILLAWGNWKQAYWLMDWYVLLSQTPWLVPCHRGLFRHQYILSIIFPQLHPWHGNRKKRKKNTTQPIWGQINSHLVNKQNTTF